MAPEKHHEVKLCQTNPNLLYRSLAPITVTIAWRPLKLNSEITSRAVKDAGALSAARDFECGLLQVESEVRRGWRG